MTTRIALAGIVGGSSSVVGVLAAPGRPLGLAAHMSLRAEPDVPRIRSISDMPRIRSITDVPRTSTRIRSITDVPRISSTSDVPRIRKAA